MITINIYQEFSSKEEMIEVLREIAVEIYNGSKHGIGSWEIKGDDNELKRKLNLNK